MNASWDPLSSWAQLAAPARPMGAQGVWDRDPGRAGVRAGTAGAAWGSLGDSEGWDSWGTAKGTLAPAPAQQLLLPVPL